MSKQIVQNEISLRVVSYLVANNFAHREDVNKTSRCRAETRLNLFALS